MKKQTDMSISLEEGLDKYRDAEDRALARLMEDGLDGPLEPPKLKDGKIFDGRMPSDLSKRGIGEITYWYEMVEAYANYISFQAVLAEVATKNAETKREFAEAAIRKSKNGTVQQKRDAAIIDERYVEVMADYIEASTYHKVVLNLEAAARRDLRYISRLIETKKIELESGRRSDSLGREGKMEKATRAFHQGTPRGRR